jgi:hypothetical protein
MTHLIVFAGVLLLSPGLVSAPVPKAKERPLYYPTGVGTKWVMTTGTTDVAYEVTAVEQKREGVLISIGILNAKKDRVENHTKLLVSEDGLSEVEFQGEDVDPPLQILKQPEKSGVEWKIKSVRKGNLVHMTCICREPEEVTVEAGKFKAVPVDQVRTPADGKPYKSTSWYAPNVGLIKVEMKGETVLSLKSFTPAKYSHIALQNRL